MLESNRLPIVGSPTPWGAAETVTPVCAGVVFVSTPSHGGYYVAPEQRGRIAALVQARTFLSRGLLGWFEEDCDWRHVCRAFPAAFPAQAHEAAARFADVR